MVHEIWTDLNSQILPTNKYGYYHKEKKRKNKKGNENVTYVRKNEKNTLTSLMANGILI